MGTDGVPILFVCESEDTRGHKQCAHPTDLVLCQTSLDNRALCGTKK